MRTIGKIIWTNDFHNTEAITLPRADGTITASQRDRASRKLCGLADCCCGGVYFAEVATLVGGHPVEVMDTGYRLHVYTREDVAT